MGCRRGTVAAVVASLLCLVFLTSLLLFWMLGEQELLLLMEEAEDDKNTQGTSTTMPEQIHLSYGDSPTEMIVTWSTYARATGEPASKGGDGGEGDEDLQEDIIPQLSQDSMVWYRKQSEEKTPANEKKVMAVDVRFVTLNPEGAQWVHRARMKVRTPPCSSATLLLLFSLCMSCSSPVLELTFPFNLNLIPCTSAKRNWSLACPMFTESRLGRLSVRSSPSGR